MPENCCPEVSYSLTQIEKLICETIPPSGEKLILNSLVNYIKKLESRNTLIIKHPDNSDPLKKDIVEVKDAVLGYHDYQGNPCISYKVLFPADISNPEPYFILYNPLNPFGNV